MADDFKEYSALINSGQASGTLPDGRILTRNTDSAILIQKKLQNGEAETVHAEREADGGLTVNRDRRNFSQRATYDAQGNPLIDDRISRAANGDLSEKTIAHEGGKKIVINERNPGNGDIDASFSLAGSTQAFSVPSDKPHVEDIAVYDAAGRRVAQAHLVDPLPSEVTTTAKMSVSATKIDPEAPPDGMASGKAWDRLQPASAYGGWDSTARGPLGSAASVGGQSPVSLAQDAFKPSLAADRDAVTRAANATPAGSAATPVQVMNAKPRSEAGVKVAAP